ncbi:MAG: hypothetical protein AAF821_26665 [Cyanobacteria bacterium P01_D01_bin.156]
MNSSSFSENQSIQIEFNPSFPGWRWIIKTRCEGTAKDLQYFPTETQAYLDAQKALERDRQQKIAWDIMKNAFSTAQLMGVSPYNFLQGLGWLCFHTPELEKATGCVEKAAYKVAGWDSLTTDDMAEIIRRVINEQNHD